MEIDNRLALARKELGKSVVSINPEMYEKQVITNESVKFFGVKETGQIPELIVKKLISHPNLFWLTIDKAASKGRAIDTDLNNPLTYRRMTGSSSGGPINILKGINDFAVGTDGGGSVLAPAMSCQLPSIIGAGLGLYVKNPKKSTDGRIFNGSIGTIGKCVSDIVMVMELLTGQTLTNLNDKKLKIIIPKKGSVTCPDKIDMYKKVMHYLSKISHEDYEVQELDMQGIDNRTNGINIIEKAFNKKEADLIITCEGPVDVYGYGETIPQYFGNVGMDITKNHGKYLLRAANMCETTAITIPTNDLATGLLVIARKGLEHSKQAIHLAKKLEDSIDLPEAWKRYYIDEQKTDSLEFF